MAPKGGGGNRINSPPGILPPLCPKKKKLLMKTKNSSMMIFCIIIPFPQTSPPLFFSEMRSFEYFIIHNLKSVQSLEFAG